MNDEFRSCKTSRRGALTAMGTGAAPVLLAAAGAASAQPAAPRGPQAPRAGMQDPRGEYPRPPFPPQRQDWPGSVRQMQPRPDHGESSYVGSGRLAERKALITGGDSGIGRAAAIAFAREGADVAISHLPAEEEDPDAREVLALIQAAGRKGISVPGDIRDQAFCRRLVADAARGLGGLDILGNNAARQTAQPSIADIKTEQFDATLKTNLYAMFWITKAALPLLPPGAAIINTASVVAYEPPALLLDYASTKAGIIAFTKSLAKQLVERRAGQRGGAGAVLDTPSAQWRSAGRANSAVRRRHAHGSAGAARRDRAHLRDADFAGIQLHHRQCLRRYRRTFGPVTRPAPTMEMQMKAKPDTSTERRARKNRQTTVEPFTVNPASKGQGDGPIATERLHEGLSIGRSSRSTATGAAGQLTPKDDR